MAVQVTPIAPGLPATTAIQDPAVRQFANAVADILRTSQTTEGAVAQLERAAGALSKGSGSAAPPAISQWLYSSELYQRLSGAIERVDTSAQEAIVAEALARAQAITAAQGALQTQINSINAELATISKTPAYDAAETYAATDLVTYEGGLYRALQETTGNAPTSATHWEKVGDYASLGEAVAAHALQLTDHETRVTSAEGAITAEAGARTLLATQVGANTAAIQAEAQTRATETEALSTQITTLSATVDDNAAAIQSEATARADADGALAESITTVVAEYTAADAQTLTSAAALIADEATARADADGALAEQITTLSATVDDNAAAIQSEATARADADGALAESITTVASATGVNAAAIVTEAETRTTNDLAIVQALDTLWTISGASKALSQDGKNLITNWQTATAEEWSTLQAEVLDAGGNTLYAAVAAEAEARAEQTGELYAQYTVKVDANGYVAGFGVASEATVAGQNTSSFIVLADRLAVVKPNQDGTEVPYVPFAIDETGIYFNGKVQFSNVQNAPPADATRNVYQGGWVASKAYLVGDIVLSEGNGWICIEAHTSSTANKPPASSGTTSTYWGIYTVKGEAGAPGAAGPAGATGATGPTGATGDTGASSMKIFIRSTSPSTPANSSGVPSGWSSTVPSGTSPVWESTGNRSAGGSDYVWTTPMISAEYWRRPNQTTIDGAKIYTGDAYVDTLQIKGNAVTVPLGGTFSVGGSFGPNTAPITVVTLNPHFAVITKVVIVANVIVSLSGGSTNVRARVLRDGAAIGDFSTTTQGDSTQSHTFVFSDTAPNGSRAYSIQLGNDWGDGGAWKVVSLGLALIGMQR